MAEAPGMVANTAAPAFDVRMYTFPQAGVWRLKPTHNLLK